jgi:hypothetical protein
MWQEKVEKILENRLILTDEEILVIESKALAGIKAEAID